MRTEARSCKGCLESGLPRGSQVPSRMEQLVRRSAVPESLLIPADRSTVRHFLYVLAANPQAQHSMRIGSLERKGAHALNSCPCVLLSLGHGGRGALPGQDLRAAGGGPGRAHDERVDMAEMSQRADSLLSQHGHRLCDADRPRCWLGMAHARLGRCQPQWCCSACCRKGYFAYLTFVQTHLTWYVYCGEP